MCFQVMFLKIIFCISEIIEGYTLCYDGFIIIYFLNLNPLLDTTSLLLTTKSTFTMTVKKGLKNYLIRFIQQLQREQ